MATKKTTKKAPKRRFSFLSKLPAVQRNGVVFALVFAVAGVFLLIYSFALTPGGLLDYGNGRACETLTARDVASNSSKAKNTLKAFPGFSKACKLPNGPLKVPLGGGFVYTHGLDNPEQVAGGKLKHDKSNPAKPFEAAGDSITSGRVFHTRSLNVHCTSNDYRNVVYYVHASNTPDRLKSIYLYIYQSIQTAQGMLDWEAGTMGGAAAFNMECANGQPYIRDVQSVSTPSIYDFNYLTNDLYYNHHLNDLKKHYWVFVDTGTLGSNPGGGVGLLWPDSRPIDNENNGNGFAPYASMAITWNNGGAAGGVMLLHEVGHEMGNVQDANHGNPAAPDYYSYGPTNSGGNFHASEVGDVMAYPAAAPVQQCVGEIRFDCNHDSYFNLHPPAGSWVSKYWQVGSPRNHYVNITY